MVTPTAYRPVSNYFGSDFRYVFFDNSASGTLQFTSGRRTFEYAPHYGVRPVTGLLEGMRILLLEDEFLIAIDVEQLCLDAGALDVILARDLSEAEKALSNDTIDAAIVDVMLGSESTFTFAQKLVEFKVPFVFASGYQDGGEMRKLFPNVVVIGKPYSGNDLIKTLVDAKHQIRSQPRAME